MTNEEIRNESQPRLGAQSLLGDLLPVIRPRSGSGLRVGLRFPKAGNTLSFFPLPPLFEQFKALETLEHISLATQRGGRAQTTML